MAKFLEKAEKLSENSLSLEGEGWGKDENSKNINPLTLPVTLALLTVLQYLLKGVEYY